MISLAPFAMKTIKKLTPTIGKEILKYTFASLPVGNIFDALFGGKLFCKSKLDPFIGYHFLQYMKSTHPFINNGSSNYDSEGTYVNKTENYQRVIFKRECKVSYLFFVSGSPVFVTRAMEIKDGSTDLGGDGWDSSNSSLAYDVFYFRGLLDLDTLLYDIVSKKNNDVLNKFSSRFIIKNITGDYKSKSQSDSGRSNAPFASDEDEDMKFNNLLSTHVNSWKSALTEGEPVGYSYEDFLENEIYNEISTMALDMKQLDVVEELKKWKDNKKWFKNKKIPWKRGYLLHGPPGTGKTSFVRAVGSELDIPIYSFDLTTFTNGGLMGAWEKVIENSPAIVLMEDIDAVFNQRENVANTPLKFDKLLNCIDGVQRSDGILLFITTNHPETLDPALANIENEKISRPGRIDSYVEFEKLGREGKKKIAERIFEEKEIIEFLLSEEKEDETGAQFQERCVCYAYKHFWEKQNEDDDKTEEPGSSSKK